MTTKSCLFGLLWRDLIQSLIQNANRAWSRCLVYSPEDDGSGSAYFSAEGVVAVNLRHLDLVPLLRCVLTEDEVTSIDLTQSVAILQPDRVHFDRPR